MTILCFNTGSATVKYRVFIHNTRAPLGPGPASRIGDQPGAIEFAPPDASVRVIYEARRWVAGVIADYVNRPHDGVNSHTPAVIHGRVDTAHATRQAALYIRYAAHPERKSNGPPQAKRSPESVAINPDDGVTDAASIIEAPKGLSNSRPSRSIFRPETTVWKEIINDCRNRGDRFRFATRGSV